LLRNILTVDVEEWFHVCGVSGDLSAERWDSLPSRVEATTEYLLQLFDRAGARATFFVLGWVADRHPRLIERIRSAGHEIGSHGHSHGRAFDLGRDAFRADLRSSLRSLAATGVTNVALYRAPEWSVNHRSLWALDILADEGFRVDSSMAPVKIVGATWYPRAAHVRSTPRGPIVEVPPLVCDRFGQVMPIGWGWGLRMSSPRRVLAAIDRVNATGDPAVLAVHPWELDPDPPRAAMPAGLRFAHYFRLGGFPERLRDILKGSSFGSLGEFAAPLVSL
jgi:polysaccharide deacetylase family protein (PEP-CTERM system associated)